METLEILSAPTVFANGADNITSRAISLGEIAAKDVRVAEVLKDFGLDYCCGGKKSLEEACEELGLDLVKVKLKFHEVVLDKAVSRGFDFNRWELDFLADYIYNEHHKYYYDEGPVIAALMDKVVNHHGSSHPFLKNLAGLFSTLQTELSTHFAEEETVIFPAIKILVIAKLQNIPLNTNEVLNITTSLKDMEADHEAAGSLLREMRSVTNDYTLPSDACNSFSLLYHKLIALEEGLHQHIHLENNILFKKAALLQQELLNVTL